MAFSSAIDLPATRSPLFTGRKILPSQIFAAVIQTSILTFTAAGIVAQHYNRGRALTSFQSISAILVQTSRQWDAASKADWGLAVERETVIRPLAEDAKLTKDRLQEAMLQLSLGRSVLYKLIHRYRQRPQTSSLLPWKRGRGSNVRLLDSKKEELLHSCIQEFYLTPERPSMAALMREIKRCFFEKQLSPPHFRTVQRRVKALDLGYVMRKREGSKRTRERLGPVRVSTLQSELPMDILQIDHTLVDVMVVDRERRLWIGRPWLTLAIDIASRAVVGFSVSLEPPSTLSVSLALSHAVLP